MEATLAAPALVLVDIPVSAMRSDLVRRTPTRGVSIADHSGETHGGLTVVGFAGFIGRHAAWLASCECGRQTVVRSNRFAQCRADDLRGCGHCTGISSDGLRQQHSLYFTWRGMLARCFDKTDNSYKYYGGRGITMCEQWRTSFAAFVSDMGDKPSPEHSIERENNDGNYEPSNCRWATRKEQRANQRPRQRKPPVIKVPKVREPKAIKPLRVPAPKLRMITLRVNQYDYEQIQATAIAAGVSMNTFCKQRLLTK